MGYGITTRADGELLTALKYNADHQTHPDNQTLQNTDDYSLDLTQSRVQTSPATLATTAAGELERIRYMLARLGGESFWDQVGGAKPGVLLTNKTAGGLVAGDVVGLGTGTDSAVELKDTLGAVSSWFVATETIGVDAIGRFHKAGLVSAKSTGVITRGDYVQKSATTKAVETLAAGSTTTSAPADAIGRALAAASGGFVTMLLFDPPTLGGLTIVGRNETQQDRTSSGDYASVTVNLPVGALVLVAFEAFAVGPTNSHTFDLKANGTALSFVLAPTVVSGSAKSSVIAMFWLAINGGKGGATSDPNIGAGGPVGRNQVDIPAVPITSITPTVAYGAGSATVSIKSVRVFRLA